MHMVYTYCQDSMIHWDDTGLVSFYFYYMYDSQKEHEESRGSWKPVSKYSIRTQIIHDVRQGDF